jgi:hypothetical protein
LDELKMGIEEERIDVFDPSRGQIVQYLDLVAFIEQALHQVRPDEACTASHQESHELSQD